MGSLFDCYRTLHEQGFIPIFTRDTFDIHQEVEACVLAGCNAIEFTLRQPQAREMIPWIRKHHPKLQLLVGSTIDDDKIVRQLQRKHSQLMTLAELADLGVDGFVSMYPIRHQTIERYAPTHLLIPAAMTAGESLEQLRAGASFIKILGPQLDLARTLRSAPTFELCPLLITNGMDLDRIPLAVESGVMLIGAGFDLLLRGQDPTIQAAAIAPRLKQYIQAVAAAREVNYPELSRARHANRAKWLATLPHYHPFD